jgi:hypothetical protein
VRVRVGVRVRGRGRVRGRVRVLLRVRVRMRVRGGVKGWGCRAPSWHEEVVALPKVLYVAIHGGRPHHHHTNDRGKEAVAKAGHDSRTGDVEGMLDQEHHRVMGSPHTEKSQAEHRGGHVGPVTKLKVSQLQRAGFEPIPRGR